MTRRAADKIAEGLHEAIESAKCEHDYVEGATASGRRVLRCMRCKVTVHFIDADGQHARMEE